MISGRPPKNAFTVMNLAVAVDGKPMQGGNVAVAIRKNGLMAY